MKYAFANRVTNVKPSAIRELFKLMGGKDIIPFSGGSPAKEAFPCEDIACITNHILQENPISVLQYSVSEGIDYLRDMVKEHMKTNHNSVTEKDEVVITSGAQQAIEIICKIFGNDGDTILVESPSFVGSLSTFKVNNMNIVGVPMDDEGICPDLLEIMIQEHKNVKLLYLIPNFQNPTGITMSWERRKQVYKIAQKYGIIIIEDNPYGDLRFKGDNVPNVKTLDTDGIVCYVGTFSKTIAPGLRVGYILANSEIIDRATLIKQFEDAHSNPLSQVICYEYFKNHNIQDHINFVRNLYAEKCNLMIEEMNKNFPKEISYKIPDGGMFIWCSINDTRIEPDEFVDLLIHKYGVAIVAGSNFMPYNEKVYNFRLNFTVPTEQQIRKGIKAIADAAVELLEKK